MTNYTDIIMSLGTSEPPPEPVPDIKSKKRDFYPFPAMKQKAEKGKTEIMKALHRGAPIMFLFLQATELIALLTGDKVFSEQCARDSGAVYGRGLGELASLQIDDKQARQRLARLREARDRETIPEYRRALDIAIREHETLIKNLEERMAAEPQRA